MDIVFWIAPGYRASKANRTIQTRLDALQDNPHDKRVSLDLEVIEKIFARELTRHQRIEDKAIRSLATSSISTTLLVAGLGYSLRIEFLDSDSWAASGFLILGILATFYLLLASFQALDAYELVGYHFPSLEDQSGLVSERGYREILVACIDRNQLLTTKQSNLVLASLQSIRNAILLISLAIFLALSSYLIERLAVIAS